MYLSAGGVLGQEQDAVTRLFQHLLHQPNVCTPPVEDRARHAKSLHGLCCSRRHQCPTLGRRVIDDHSHVAAW